MKPPVLVDIIMNNTWDKNKKRMVFIRDEIYIQGGKEEITAALRHELGELQGEDHVALRQAEEHDQALRDLITQIFAEDKR